MKTHRVIHPRFGLLKTLAVETALTPAQAAELLEKTCDELAVPRPGVVPPHIVSGPERDAFAKPAPIKTDH